MAGGEVMHDVLRRPAAARHDDRARSDVVESIALHICDDDVRRARRIAGVLDADDGAIEPQPRRLARPIERAEVDAILPHRVDGAGTGEGVGDERLHHQSRESAVAVGEHLVAELVVAVLRKLVLNRVVAVRRQHVGPQTVSTTLDGRQKRPHRLPTDVVSCHQVIFERDRVELSRNGVAFSLRSRSVDAVRPPAQQLRSRDVADRGALELPSPWVYYPHPRSLAELRSEVEAVVLGRLVRRVSERHLRRRPAPRLVGERGAIHSDHLVEAIRVATLPGHQEDRGTLVRGEALSVDEELVALRFAAEDRVVVDDEATSALVFMEEDRGGESADSAADGDEVVHLAGVAGVGDTLFERAIAHPVSDAQYIPGVAVGVPVVAYAAVAVEGIGGGHRWRFTVEEQPGTGEESAIEEVTAGDRLADAEAIVADHSSLSARCLMVVRK